MRHEENNARREIVIGPATFRHLPDGIYKAMLVEINDEVGAFNNDVYEPWFEIIHGLFVGSLIKDMINKKSATAKNSKLCSMIRALDSTFVAEVMSCVNLDDLIKKRCFIKTERRGKNVAIVGYYSIGEIENAK